MKMVLVGISGYGAVYIDFIKEYVNLSQHPLVAVVEPFPERSAHLAWLRARNIPIYASLDEFYKNGDAGLVMICSPIQFHAEQMLTAMRHGSAVLCEKPLAPTPEDALRVLQAREETGVAVGVGFQWTFSSVMRELKRDVLAGKFGKAQRLRQLVAWKRDDAYYDPAGWKGRIRDGSGRLVMDSIAMNATAHYLHNMLFILGDTMDAAATPACIEGLTYRARPIESYDTVFLRGQMPCGAEIIFTASHVTETNVNPVFSYEFEKGTVTFGDHTGQEARAVFADGSEKSYGFPQSKEEAARKITSMIRSIEEGSLPACGIETVMPHLTVCKKLHDHVPVRDFPPETLRVERLPAGRSVKGLNEAMAEFYETGRLPQKNACRWAEQPVSVCFEEDIQ